LEECYNNRVIFIFYSSDSNSISNSIISNSIIVIIPYSSSHGICPFTMNNTNEINNNNRNIFI
jgi:hypothetical protein